MSASARLRAEFLAVVGEVVGPMDHPDLREFRVLDTDAHASGAHISYEGVPVGPRPGQGSGAPDRRLVVEAAAVTLSRRAVRVLAGDTVPKPGDRAWVEALRARSPGWFECEVSVGPGWADLLLAMADRVRCEDPPPGFRFRQVKEKFAGLRAYWSMGNDRAGAVIHGFEAVSFAICETCGAPGRMRRKGGYYFTACDGHARGASTVREPGGDGDSTGDAW